MAQSPLGIAVIGTGFGQKIHIPGFQIHPRTQVLAVYHRNLDKARAIAEANKIPYACETVEQIVALPEVKAVSISTPPFLHYSMAKTAINAGKHVLIEKPTTLSVAEAQELYTLAAKQGVVGVVDFEFRYVPAWQHFARLLADELVGRKRLIKIDWMGASRANPERPWDWYSQQEKGGGALGAIGSHLFDYVPWLFGPVRRLCGSLSTTIPTRPDSATGEQKPVDADDTCRIMLDLEDGTPCQVTLSAVTYQGRGHWIEVYGDRGTIVLGNDNPKDYIHGFRLWTSREGNPLTEIAIPEHLRFPQVYKDGRLAPFVRVVDHWLRCIDQGKESAPSLQEGVYSQLLMDLTHESSQLGKWVDVPDLELQGLTDSGT